MRQCPCAEMMGTIAHGINTPASHVVGIGVNRSHARLPSATSEIDSTVNKVIEEVCSRTCY